MQKEVKDSNSNTEREQTVMSKTLKSEKKISNVYIYSTIFIRLEYIYWCLSIQKKNTKQHKHTLSKPITILEIKEAFKKKKTKTLKLTWFQALMI